MLVLTRKSNQSIVIGDDVVVTVLEVRGDQIRLGITAPRNVEVHREEVWIARTSAAAAAAGVEQLPAHPSGTRRSPGVRAARPAVARSHSAA